MQVKLLRQAAGRDDRIVAAYEDVTFLNEHVGWYPIIKDRFRKANDIVVVVLRVGDVCFEAGSMFRRGMLRKELYRSADCGSSQPASRRATPYGELPVDSVVLRGSLRSTGLGCPAVEGASHPYARTVCCGRPKTGTSADRTGK